MMILRYVLKCLWTVMVFVSLQGASEILFADAPTFEAERFFTESKFLAEHQRWEDALEKVETAVALKPDDPKLIEHHVAMLSAVLSDLSHKGYYWFGGDFDKMTPETIDKGFSIAGRMLQINRSRFEKSNATPKQLMTGQSATNDFFGTVDLKIEHEMKAGNDSFPCEPTRNRLLKCRREYFEFWTKSVYPLAVEKVVDKRFFTEWLWLVSNAYHFGVTNGLPFDDRAEFWKTQIPDIVRFSEQYDPDHSDFIIRNNLKYFESQSPLVLAEAEQDGNREAKKIVLALLERFRNEKKPYYGSTAWRIEREAAFLRKIGTDIPFARHDSTELDYLKKAEVPGFDAAVSAYFDDLLKKIGEIPKEIRPNEYDGLYLAASRMIDCTRDKRMVQRRRLAVCDLAFSRKDIPRHVLFHMVHYRNMPDDLPEYRARILSLYDRAILIGKAEQRKGGRLEHLPPFVEIEQWRKNVTTSIKPMEPDTAWTEEVLLLEPPKSDSSDTSFFRYDFMKLLGNRLFVLECSYRNGEKQARLVEIDLVPGNTVSGKIPYGETPYGKTLVAPCFHEAFLPYAYRRRGEFPSFIDETNLYIGTEEAGLAVFPLSGEEPWTISTKDDLPSDYVHGVGVIDGTVYLGVGKPMTQSWLMTLDPKTRRTKILASSTAKSGEAPFFDLGTPPCFYPFVLDAKRNRLLFWVSTQNGPRIEPFGLWAVDGKSGAISRLLKLECSPNKAEIVSDGDRLLVDGHFCVPCVDLRNNSFELIVSLGGPRKIFPIPDLLTPKTSRQVSNPTLLNNHLWGIFHDAGNWCFGRIDLEKPNEVEWLRIEKLQAKETGPLGEPYDQILPLPDGSGVVVGDTKRIVLLRFR